MDERVRRRRLLIVLYLGFVSLGLPDTVLGVAWPAMRQSFGVGLEWAGGLMSLVTVISVLASLATAWIMKRCGTGEILAVCALMTAGAWLGQGLAPSLAVVAACAVVFGLGQGAVDSAVNAHMSRHYSARQMTWIHGCWGLGATGGPLVFTAAYGLGLSWRAGYLALFVPQLALGLIFWKTLKLWREPEAAATGGRPEGSAGRAGAAWSARRAAAGVGFYFLYPGVEVVTGLWGASYLVEVRGVSPALAGAALTVYWAGLTLGRFAAGFAAGRVGRAALARGGLALVLGGLGWVALGPGSAVWPLGLVGLGLSPLYPVMMHATPARVGLARSDQVIGFQVGAALAGAAVWPALVGLGARHFGSLAALPGWWLVFTASLVLAHELAAARR